MFLQKSNTNYIQWDNIMQRMHTLYKDLPEHLPHYSDLSLLVAIILSAVNRDSNVIKYFNQFLLDIVDTKYAFSLTINDIEHLISKANLYKRKSLTIHTLLTTIRRNHDSLYSTNELLAIPGIGSKTVNVFLNLVTDTPLIGIDTHVYQAVNIITGMNFRSRKAVHEYCVTHIPAKWHKFVNKYMVYFSKRKFKDNINLAMLSQ